MKGYTAPTRPTVTFAKLSGERPSSWSSTSTENKKLNSNDKNKPPIMTTLLHCT